MKKEKKDKKIKKINPLDLVQEQYHQIKEKLISAGDVHEKQDIFRRLVNMLGVMQFLISSTKTNDVSGGGRAATYFLSSKTCTSWTGYPVLRSPYLLESLQPVVLHSRSTMYSYRFHLTSVGGGSVPPPYSLVCAGSP
jgi:hypothetical protein